MPQPSFVANLGSFKLLDPSVELAEVRVVSAIWDLLDRPLGVRRLLDNDTPGSEENELSGGSPPVLGHAFCTHFLGYFSGLYC